MNATPEPCFTLEPAGPDPLGVLASTAPVVRQTEVVRIDGDAAARFARQHVADPVPRPVEDALHCTFLPPRRFLNYLLALEAVNFCFWDDEPRWRVTWQGATHDGYWALAAALHRAVCSDARPVWDAHYLAGLDEAALAHLLRGEGRPVPLLAERLAHLREAGQVLLESWQGQFASVVTAAEGSAPRLAALVAEAFPSFRDVATWGGEPVRFYKRAQILAGDLSRMLTNHPLGRLQNLGALTAFADYKLPQVLRGAGVLVLAPALAARVDARAPLPAGGVDEVALRAATVWACEWLARALTAERRALPGSRGADTPPATAMEVDYLLWSAGQADTSRSEGGLPPYHRTRTVYY